LEQATLLREGAEKNGREAKDRGRGGARNDATTTGVSARRKLFLIKKGGLSFQFL